MPRYFIEVAYVGTRYSGFQVQLNANTIQAEVTRALKIFFNKTFELTGSSRTDAGVHALQNYFHFDSDIAINNKTIYGLNALLPYDIVIKRIFEVQPEAHCRYDAIARTYHYFITRFKDPFHYDRSFYYPFATNQDLLKGMAESLTGFTDFTSFSKKKTQAKTFNCSIKYSRWIFEENTWCFEIKADRFLRGMVKGLVGTMLRLAKNNEGVVSLKKIFETKQFSAADFSASSSGLFLIAVDLDNKVMIALS